VRTYLGAHGGWRGVAALGSVACVGRDGLGGHKGRGLPLAEGDRLEVASPLPPLSAGAQVPLAHRIDYGSAAELSVIPVARLGTDGGSLHQALQFALAGGYPRRPDGHQANRACVGLPSPGHGLRGPGRRCNPGPARWSADLSDERPADDWRLPRLGTLTPIARARLAQCMASHPVMLRASGTERARHDYFEALTAMESFRAN